ncbi:P-type ATPase [Brucella anthropi]|uniref:P-type ATPase n=1 Tax=Brucella anthropi TaxID=529 RepID=UPI000E00CC60|nr:HAD family hydrolase [Brucella anthropi]SUB55972.1 Copper-exporting P-type ATPase A [Brucella anthropi]
MSRLADQWSIGFLIVTVLIAFGAWFFTGDPIRSVAVLVVATPCPLILAVPVALVAGLSRAAHFGVLVKGARPLENMARINTLVLDKTGTLTDGRPQITSINAQPGLSENDLLRFAASLDQVSKHPMAQALVLAAQRRGIDLVLPTDVSELAGDGVAGWVDRKSVVVGGHSFVERQVNCKTE